MNPTRKELEDYMAYLCSIDVYDEEQEMSVFKGCTFPCDSVTRCTTSAMYVARKFGGKVFGYTMDWEKEYKDKIGYGAGGHDFAIVGDFLVDWWAENVECEGKAILHLTTDSKEIGEKYLPQDQWGELELW